MTTVTKTGDLLTSDAEIICQQVNCLGVMGAGLAKQIRDTYPEVFAEYMKFCTGREPCDLLGKAQIVQASKYKVCNIFGQAGVRKQPGQQCTVYAALNRAFASLKDYCLENGISSIAVPYGMGCGLGGGDWDVVWANIYDAFEDTNVEIQIWRYDNGTACNTVL